MQDRSRKPTIVDVAKAARVSVSTVYRVLNNVTPFSREIGEAVTSAADQVGYKRQGKRTSSFGAVFVVVPDLMNPYFYEIAQGIDDEARMVDGFLHVVKVQADSKAEKAFIRQIGGTSCEGTIICSSSCISDDRLQEVQQKTRAPIVTINRTRVLPGICSVKIDFADAMYRATRYLLNLNHLRIAFLCGLPTSESGQEKREGILSALQERHVTTEARFWLSGSPTLEWGFHAMNTLLDVPVAERPTAVMAYNDMMALGAMHAIRSRKMHVPGDISVIGFDDITMAANANPPLTTISQPKHDLGRLAFRLIVELRNGVKPQMSNITVLDSPLVVRDSTQLRVEQS